MRWTMPSNLVMHNLCYALYWSNMTHIQLREFGSVRERAMRLQSLGRDEGYPQWMAFGAFQEGVALAGLGDCESGAARMQQGIKDYRALDSVLYLPFMEAQLAIALASTGHGDEAISTISNAILQAQRTKELWFEAEIHRIQGDLLQQGAPDAAEASYRRGLDLAREQRAKAWELRAATSLACLLRDQGNGKQAHELLAPVHVWFTEGHESPDLQEAKQLLEELGST
jgi:predicted ATPase